jgi:fructose-specific phosphotransferase system IIC component
MNHCIETDPDNPCVVGSVAYTTICLAIGMETALYIKNQQQQKTQTNKKSKTKTITGLYVISEAAFTIALLGELLYKYLCSTVEQVVYKFIHF